MFTKKPPAKRSREQSERVIDLPELAIAAIFPCQKQKDGSDFTTFLLESLERHSKWLNNVVGRQTSFRCALMVGAGPNRFQIQEIIYPSDDSDLKLEVELKDCEDYDKIAVAALIKLSNTDLDSLLKYTKTRLFENSILKEDLLKGKALGISFAILRAFAEKQYRVMERIVIGSSMKYSPPAKKVKDDGIFKEPPLKRGKKIHL